MAQRVGPVRHGPAVGVTSLRRSVLAESGGLLNTTPVSPDRPDSVACIAVLAETTAMARDRRFGARSSSPRESQRS